MKYVKDLSIIHVLKSPFVLCAFHKYHVYITIIGLDFLIMTCFIISFQWQLNEKFSNILFIVSKWFNNFIFFIISIDFMMSIIKQLNAHELYATHRLRKCV